jgi:cystathionine beta-lyase/cystathionine gamma-synthase
MRKETRVNHPPRVELPEGNRPVVAPIYRSVKFTNPSIADALRPEVRQNGFAYTRGGNPTTRQLEQLTAQLQETEDALAVGSGMAAVTTCLMGVLSAGDNLALFVESYKPTRALVREILPRFGITHTLLSVGDWEGIERAFARDETKMVFFESPTNPMLRVPDIARLAALARKHHVMTALDNTFAGFHNHGQYELDYFVHSLTKYASGHGDVMGGMVLGSAERIRALRPLAGNFGAVLDPGVSYLILRGMRTYYLRYRQQCESALALAQHLKAQERVAAVYYPGLVDDPGHSLACEQMSDFGGVVTFEIDADKDQTWAFIDALDLFITSASLGSAESLVAPVKLYWAYDLQGEDLERSMIKDNTVRIAVGLEHVEDLKADLDQALAQVFG